MYEATTASIVVYLLLSLGQGSVVQVHCHTVLPCWFLSC